MTAADDAPSTRRSLARAVRRAGSRGYSVTASIARRIHRRWFATRTRPPLYDGSVLDDLLFAQPLNIIPRLALVVGRHRRAGEHGVTVVIVNYNTLPQLQIVVNAVRRFSPADTAIVVVDNASTDGSRAWLRTQRAALRVIRLPVNLGHGRALDIGIAAARTGVVITLDSDAFPYRSTWLESLVAPLHDPDIVAVGWRGARDRLHPACTALLRAVFLDRRTSYANYNLHADLGQSPEFGVNTWDTGELLFTRLGRDHVVLLDTCDVPSFGGQQMGDIVYHHCGMTTLQEPGDRRDPVRHTAGWQLAVLNLLGEGGA